MARFWWLALVSSAAFAQERWFQVQIGGKTAGRAHEVVSQATAGGIETASESQTLIARVDAKLELKVRARMTENEEGILRAVHVETDMSAQTTFTDVIIAG